VLFPRERPPSDSTAQPLLASHQLPLPLLLLLQLRLQAVWLLLGEPWLRAAAISLAVATQVGRESRHPWRATWAWACMIREARQRAGFLLPCKLVGTLLATSAPRVCRFLSISYFAKYCK
jgi:hypothetical protein